LGQREAHEPAHRLVPQRQPQRPQAVAEVYRLLRAAKEAAPAPAGVDPAPFGIEASRPALEMIIDYSVQQRMIPRRLTVDELFAETAALIGAA